MNLRDVFCHKTSGFSALILLSMVIACSQAQFTKQEPVAGSNVVPGPTEPPVCNPFGGGTGGTSRNGLVGSIYYASGAQAAPTYQRSSEYIQFGHRMNAALYLNDINVPTRQFNQGFSYQNGQYLRREDGAMLIEDFALSLTSNIKLAADDPDGNYEFAILSDDGAILRIGQNGTSSVLVDNDNVHPPRMGCAENRAIAFNHSTVLPIRIDYFQGPRFHINFMLIWRRVSNTTPAKDPLCGATDTNNWFNEYSSAPGPWYNDIYSRGWRPVRSVNYWLDSVNPCTK